MLKVKIYEGENRKAIEKYLERSDSANLYHDIRWLDVIEESFGHSTYYLYTTDEEENVTGVLPLAHMKSFLFGNFLVSLPFFNYGGISANESVSRNKLLEKSIALARDLGAEYVELRQDELLSEELPVKTEKVSMRLLLPPSPEELWKFFPSKLRSQVKRPLKEGMEASIGREEELKNFYRVFSANMRDLGTPVYPVQFFRNILDRFGENSWICTVYQERAPIASGFLVGFKNILEIPWASSLREYNNLSPNMLLYWKCLEFACDKGFSSFDFGRSTPGEGTYRFKKQWGAVPHQLYWHYWLKKGDALPNLTTKNPRYTFAINAWKRLPVQFTNLLGPHIVKYIP